MTTSRFIGWVGKVSIGKSKGFGVPLAGLQTGSVCRLWAGLFFERLWLFFFILVYGESCLPRWFEDATRMITFHFSFLCCFLGDYFIWRDSYFYMLYVSKGGGGRIVLVSFLGEDESVSATLARARGMIPEFTNERLVKL